MAQQITNTFLKSKMNKDLDDRILPNGEYRDARNISVGRSEDNDVGALENIIGNNLVASTDLGSGLTIIGMHKSNSTDEIFIFLTNYTDPLPLTPTNAPAGSLHYIYVYNHSNESYTRLVEGEFLNFSTTNRIIGINLIERLLFWTDNRNQPRKINVNLANPTQGGAKQQEYYTQEHQISVAKYNPYQPIELYNRIDVEIESAVNGYFLVPGDQVAKFTPFIGATVVSAENNIGGDQFIKVTSASFVAGKTRVFVSPVFTSPVPTNDSYITLISSTMTNETDNLDWPGDPDYLEDRFVRFSYRFKYDDNEYSLMAPFTQIAYIPKQGGFFIAGDENSAYQSTIVDFMENFVQNIGLVIPLPTNANRLLRDYKISELEILFRESNGVAVKVLESVSAGEINASSGISNRYTYDYQSRKPYKTLPEAQTVRVYDKVPVRAFSQESSGNRIIYGNYRDQHTPPANLNYNCVVSDKFSSGTSNNWVEYPNHSVKRNRNYQIGFVLADKFGRQSPVILSSVDTGVSSGGSFFSGSTIYSSYDANQEDTVVRDWFGDSIKVIVNAQITSNINTSTGTPGLYAIEQQEGTIGTGIGFATLGSPVIVSDSTYTFSLSSTAYPNNDNIPRQNDYLRGAYEDFVEVTNITGPSGGGQVYTVTTSGRVNDVYLRADNLPVNTPDIKFAYTINDLGWYSYKVVVKQTEQDYYNVYLPGILNGYPGQSGYPDYEQPPGTMNEGARGAGKGLFPSDETNLTAFTPLFNDNINKIPRDLQEVGPDQKQYSSSVTLYGIVTNIMTIDTNGTPFTDSIPFNTQYYPRLSSSNKNAISHKSTAIANAKEVNMSFSDLSNEFNAGNPTAPNAGNTGAYSGNLVFYQINTDPLIARISTTEKSIGATAASINSGGTYTNTNTPTFTANMLPYLAIYETEPVESLLDIYWETTSSGLIVDLNTAVSSGSGAAQTFADVVWNFPESAEEGDYVTTNYFFPLNEEGNPFLVGTTATIVSQVNGAGDSVEYFEIEEGTNTNVGKYKLRLAIPGKAFIVGSKNLDVYRIGIEITAAGSDTNVLYIGGSVSGEGALKNVIPTFNTISSVSAEPADSVVIPAQTWVNANPSNGTSLTGNVKRNGLEYTFTMNPSSAEPPQSWNMDINTGELTQLPDDTGPGVYETIVSVTDCNGVSDPDGSSGDYGPLTFSQNLQIVIGAAAVNPGVTSSGACVVNPTGDTAENIFINQENTTKSGIFYITGESSQLLNFEQIVDENEDMEGYNGAPIKLNNYATPNAHERGILNLSFNIKQLATAAPQGSSSFDMGELVYYYRKFGDTQWTTLKKFNEFNKVSTNNNPINSPSNDYPTGNIFPVANNQPNNNKWWQINRAVNVLDLPSPGQNEGDAFEYAVLVKNLKCINSSFNNAAVIGWVTADDLNFPACINRSGLNIGNVGNNNPSYKYYRSNESDSSLNFQTIIEDAAHTLYARTPLGEYVDVFYTDSGLTNIYTPGQNSPFINFKLDVTTVNPNITANKWTFSQGNDLVLQWIAGFNYVNGVKLESTRFGASAFQTTVYPGSPDDSAFQTLNATTRLRNPL
jgi:hypothetical protein